MRAPYPEDATVAAENVTPANQFRDFVACEAIAHQRGIGATAKK
jgi:hypothetical protein